ncbi:hypothetical protein GS982_20370 [Rhodococcus hoagii]|nr:hypothetical protein [Prescottella equi]NKZ84550.1 hypothetical protein [Prescottella equi]
MTPDLARRFDYHRPGPEQVQAHEAIREAFRLVADYVDARVPEGREKATAMTKIEEAMFWSNAGIARAVA